MYPFDIQKNKPKGFPSIKKEPVFNPKTDLQLEKPKKIKNLKELGYSNKELKGWRGLISELPEISPTNVTNISLGHKKEISDGDSWERRKAKIYLGNRTQT